MDTVTISLNRFKELETFEQIVKESKDFTHVAYGYYTKYFIQSKDEMLEQMAAEIDRLNNELNEKQILLNEIRDSRNGYKTRSFWKKYFGL